MNTTHTSGTCSPADIRLVEALRRGEEAAFAELSTRHEGLMLRVASTYVLSRAVAQEVVQDTWLSVFKGIDSFECRSSLKTWIFRILVNRAKTRGAGERRTIPFSSWETAESNSFDPELLIDRARIEAAESESPERILIARETVDYALRAIDDLPDNQRQVIAMRDIQGCSSEEVCSTLGISRGNQRVQLHRARASVGRELKRYLTPAALPASQGI